MIGFWVPSEAQENEGPGPRSAAPPAENGESAMQKDNAQPPAPDADDPYGPPALAMPGNAGNPDVTEPANINELPADSSIANHEVRPATVVPPPPVAAAATPLMRFEEDMPVGPAFDSTQAVREQAQNLSEDADVPDLLPPPDTLPSLSMVPTFRLGPATVAVGLRYQALYDNNILLLSNNPQGDFEHIVSPRLSLSLGNAGYGITNENASANAPTANAIMDKPNYLVLNYDPQFIFFHHYGQYNAFEQALRLTGQYVLSRTVLRETLLYNHSTDPDRELQGRVSRDVVSSDTSALYRASDRISYVLGGTALVQNYEQGINSDQGRLQFSTRYTATPNWTVLLGAAGGDLLPEKGTSQVFEQASLGTQTQIGTDLSVYLSFAGDFREPGDSGKVRLTPLFDANIRYQPSPETQVELSAHRQIFSSSGYINQDYVSTRITLKATQRLWQTYKVAADLGYENADYFQFGAQTAGPRSDNYPTARVEFSYERFDDLEAGIFYEFQKNFSSLPDSSFSGQQFGIELRIGNLNL
jgi:hypothetical protein